MAPETLLIASVGLPLVGALGIGLTGRSPNLRETITLLTSVATAGCVFQLCAAMTEPGAIDCVLLEFVPGAPVRFTLEPLGMLFALVASGLWVLTSLYAIGYMRGHHETHQTRFYVCFALAISAALGIAYAGNLLTLFLFYEALTFSTYPLVTHHGTAQAMRAGRVYLGILVSTSVGLLLLAILWTWQLAGTLDFRPGGILAGKAEGWEVGLLLGLYTFGVGKAALMPFHRWLPAAMVAPTPVSALLHAVAVVKAGVFCVLKITVYVFGLDFLSGSGQALWLMYVAAFTIVAASVVAMRQDNLKRRLAYSTISQLAYIVLGAALSTPHAALGGALHIAMHAVSKITLFFAAGAIDVAAHKTEVSQLNGIGRRMPFTLGAFLLASLSLIGLPPFGGMWSKWYLALGAADAQQEGFILVYMLSSLLSIAYLMPVVVRAFFMQEKSNASPEPSSQAPTRQGFWPELKEAPALCVVPLCLTALGSALLFVFADPLRTMLLPLVGG